MKRFKKIIILGLLLFVFFFFSNCVFSKTSSGSCKDKLQQVALFKNGLGFFISEVQISSDEKSFYVVPQAAPSHGTFWISYPEGVKVDSLIARQVESEEAVEAITISEVLRANVGRRVRIMVSGKEIDCVIKSFAEDRESTIPNPYAPGSERMIPNYRYPGVISSSVMIIQTDAGQLCVSPSSVGMIEFFDEGAEETFSKKAKAMQLEVRLAEPAAGEKLTLSYLAKGITWAPSYIVDVSEKDKARLSAKAVVINEVCDLDDIQVQLVTGYPNLQFADIVSPIAMKEKLAQFLQSLARGESERGTLARASVMSQRVSYDMDAVSVLMPEYGAAQAGTVAEDLFFYPVEKVRLAKGEVGYYPLFTESVSYKHIYKWKIPDYVNEEDRYYYDRQRQQGREPGEEVWHCLRMENTTKVPWTTAPAEIVQGSLILGQDTLNYTPLKGETDLRITKAVSVKAEQLELETGRTRDAAQLYGYHYDLITVEGELSVTNFQDKAITLEVTKTLSGEIKSSEPKAKVEKLARGLHRMNGALRLTWTIELKKGQKKKINYIYDVYVRR